MLTSTIFSEALSSSASFDPILKELLRKGMSLEDLVAADISAKEKVRILKGLARNAFKVFMIKPEPMAVEEGLEEDEETRSADVQAVLTYLRPLFNKAYLQANGVPPKAPLGFYAVRSGQAWVEVYKFESAIKPSILGLRDRVEITNYFG